ncbi:MAG: rod shape-determining protein MreD [Thermoanaerobaculia bacterium]
MDTLKLLAALALAALVHFVGMSLWPGFGRSVDVFLVVVVLHALGGSSLSALAVGLVAGLLQDTLASGPFGLLGFADTIVGYVTARLAQRLVIQRPTGVLAVMGFASVLQQAVAVALTLVLLPSPELPRPLWVAVRAGVTAVLGMAVYVGMGNWRRASEARRRGRMNRLRMG